MEVTQTHGAFSWNELTTPDPAKAAEFYGPLFGWSFRNMGADMDDYVMASVGEVGVAGLMRPPPGVPTPPSWGCYVTVVDVEATLAQVTALGGKVVMGPLEVPGVGHMGIFLDPQGAMLSVMQYTP